MSAEVSSDGSVDVTLLADATALFVTLTTGEQGVFSDNVLTLLPNEPRKITLQPIKDATPIDPKRLEADLRVEHVEMYLGGSVSSTFV